jgi:3-hydroxyisobutyrate dehydrogenase-like beta-hydroxyacid dehydrogenase
MLVEERFHPAGFRAALGRKDMRLFAEVAAAGQVAAPFLTIIEAQLAALVARHGPDIDWAAIGALPAEVARSAHHPEKDA